MHVRSWMLGCFLVCAPAWAAEYTADPATLNQRLTGLKAGDTLRLAAGTYQHFTVSGLNGNEAAWITITGPESGAPAIVEANGCCNTVELKNSSYVALRHLTVDGRDNGGSFGVSAKDGTSNKVHHIRVERCTFDHHAGSQQQVAISTKTPTWGWEIRENRVLNAGTGLYLGNSDGTMPFVRGVIERNLVKDPVGYCMQVKFQKPWPTTIAGFPTGKGSTVIRHNVFIKNDAASPDGDRPNLLVGGFPDSGDGAEDRYEIYGNFFFHNPRESLLQASGRVSVHDNVFVDAGKSAVHLANHDLPLKQAWVYNNTVYGAATGLNFASAASQGSAAVGNVVFAAKALGGTPADLRDNLTGTEADAAAHLVAPGKVLGSLDLYPKAGACSGSALDLATFAADQDVDRDFNGTSKGGRTYRGAYAGEGTNPGWALAAEVKGEASLPPGPDAGVAGPDASAAVDATATPSPDTGAQGQPDVGQADAGTIASPDAGQQGPDAGAVAGQVDSGCGCGVGAGPSALALSLLCLEALRCRVRRRRQVGE